MIQIRQNIRNAIRAHRAHEASGDAYRVACRRAFPVGYTVEWEHGNYVRSGVVEMHSDFGEPRLRVRSASGRSYWIFVYPVLRYEGLLDD